MITMLVPLMLALAVETPSPAPSAAAPPTRLQEIGRVQALSVCTTIVVHANSAISEALSNDTDIAITINRLQTTDLDGANEIQRHRAMADLSMLATRIREASSAGDAEVKRLRALAAAAPDVTRKAELKAFADALGGALYRQKRAAVDLHKMLAIIDGRQAVAGVRTSRDPRGMRPSSAFGDDGFARESYNDSLRQVAADFQDRTKLILDDEGVAADHSLGATTGC